MKIYNDPDDELFDDETVENENPYDNNVDESDEDTEYGENPAWNW